MSDDQAQADTGSDRSAVASGTAALPQRLRKAGDKLADIVEAVNDSRWISSQLPADVGYSSGDLDRALSEWEQVAAGAFARETSAEAQRGTTETAERSSRELALERTVGRLEEALRGLLDALDRMTVDGKPAAFSPPVMWARDAAAALVRTGEEHGQEQGKKLDAPVPGASGTAQAGGPR